MRHRKAGKKLGRLTAHRVALFRNQLVSLFEHERIETTEAKAKALRPLADKVITLAKRENLHARRLVLRLVPSTTVVKKIFDTIAPRYADRHGGYTRLFRVGQRAGDGAPVALIELIDRREPEKAEKKGKKEQAEKGKPESKAEAKEKGKKKKAAAAAG
jgi:large subunit ribosomal protein L17